MRERVARTYYVYTLASPSRILYTGVTSNLERRVLQHRRKLLPGFTTRYNVNRLVYYEIFSDVRAGIAREKQVKGWVRERKIALIESANRDWKDLSDGWYGKQGVSRETCKDKSRARFFSRFAGSE
jgi:putative endonuclease